MFATQAIVIMCFLPPLSALQSPGIDLQLGSQVLEVGEAVDAQLVCTNIGVPTSPEATVPDGLELRLAQPNPSQSSMVSIVNGRRSERVSYTYHLRLTARQEGTYVLGPVRVMADGRSYETEPVTITVRRTTQTSDYVFVELDVQPRTLYVTQSCTATLRVGIRDLQMQGRYLDDINLFRSAMDQRASQFSIFGNEPGTQRQVWRTDAAGVRQRFSVLQVTKTVRADEPGTVTIGPVFVKVDYPTSLGRGFFGSYEVRNSRRETARAEAISVTVKAPPLEGRPAGFTGAVGRYTLTADAAPTRLEQGRPLTLTLTVRGTPLEGIAGPDLAAQAELASRFDFTTDELVGSLEGNAKVFRRALFPKQAGEQAIPPLRWSYFDTDSEQYVSLTTEPIAIAVDPPAPGGQPVPLLPQTGGTPPGEEAKLTLVAGGISPNYADVNALLASHSFAWSPAWSATLLACPIAWLGAAALVRFRTRLRADVGWARRRRALPAARRALRAAAHASEPAAYLAALADVLCNYVLERFDLPPGYRAPNEIQALLTEHGYPAASAGAVAQFLESTQAARYAPGAVDATTLRQAHNQVWRWVKQMERVTR
ncbi:MAG TPA: BatD family protein [Phycisphaerae bacterium]|nr:BatD family protein [Phycisphaerae bacterium]HNU44848.1 BatD family protein [Phycisphaerae bacterium]